MKSIKCIFIVFLLIINLNPIALSETNVIQTSGKFVMGDTDSKTDARKMALLNAKQMALEQAGVYLTSKTEVENHTLTKDQISSLAAGIISVKVIDEKWTMEGESPVVILKIEAVVDTENLEDQIKSIQENQEKVEDYQNIRTELDGLKAELAELKKKKDTATSEIDTETVKQAEKSAIQKMIALETVQEANLDLEKGNASQAIKNLDTAAALAPDQFNVYLSRSRANLKLKKYNKALQDINKALEKKPTSLRAHLIKIDILLKINQASKALKYCLKTLQLKPNCGACYFQKGHANLQLKRFKAAYKDFSKACSLGIQKGCNKVKNMGKNVLIKKKERIKKRRPIKGKRP